MTGNRGERGRLVGWLEINRWIVFALVASIHLLLLLLGFSLIHFGTFICLDKERFFSPESDLNLQMKEVGLGYSNYPVNWKPVRRPMDDSLLLLLKADEPMPKLKNSGGAVSRRRQLRLSRFSQSLETITEKIAEEFFQEHNRSIAILEKKNQLLFGNQDSKKSVLFANHFQQMIGASYDDVVIDDSELGHQFCPIVKLAPPLKPTTKASPMEQHHHHWNGNVRSQPFGNVENNNNIYNYSNSNSRLLKKQAVVEKLAKAAPPTNLHPTASNETNSLKKHNKVVRKKSY